VVPQDTLKARAQSAKSAKAVQEMASGMSTSNALAAFDRMEEKVRARLSPSLSHYSLTLLPLTHSAILGYALSTASQCKRSPVLFWPYAAWP
jgi:hypothetical protein